LKPESPLNVSSHLILRKDECQTHYLHSTAVAKCFIVDNILLKVENIFLLYILSLSIQKDNKGIVKYNLVEMTF
jgi:hypothetical protein